MPAKWDPATSCRFGNKTDRVNARKYFLCCNTRLTLQTCEVQLAVFQAPAQSDMAARSPALPEPVVVPPQDLCL